MNIRPTPYDLSWRMFGVPTRVHPTFWLIALLFSWPLTNIHFSLLFVGIGCIFVSVLIHELAHAIAFATYGMPSGVLLYSFGGLTVPEAGLRVRSQRIMVSLAGPFANFLLVAVAWTTNWFFPWAKINLYTDRTYRLLIDINLFLGILNLLPVWPLDGGQVSRELFTARDRGRGLVQSLQLSMAVAIAVAAFAVACHLTLIPKNVVPLEFQPGLFAGILFGVMAFQSYAELQNLRQSPWM